MKKWMSLFAIVSIFATSAMITGCSSSKPVEEAPVEKEPAAEEAAQPTSPVDLGATGTKGN